MLLASFPYDSFSFCLWLHVPDGLGRIDYPPEALLFYVICGRDERVFPQTQRPSRADGIGGDRFR